jgi:carboxymethylenebutenolidase
MTPIEAKTPDGTATCFLHRPSGDGPHPGVIFYIDALGVRPAMHGMAARLASKGYAVLIPNVLYRAGNYAPFDPKTVWSNQSERERLMAIINQVDVAASKRDVAVWLDVLSSQAGVRPDRLGAVGYCMGGRLAFITAGMHPDRVAAAASIHPGRLVTPDADSPHALAERIRASVYLGVADNDQSFTPEQQATVAGALGAAHVHYQMELYAGASHGFAVPDVPPYQEQAAERHWERVSELFASALG